MVERGDAVDPARRELETVGDVQQQVDRQVAKELLSFVEHFDQRIGLVLLALHRGFQDFEAIIATRMSRCVGVWFQSSGRHRQLRSFPRREVGCFQYSHSHRVLWNEIATGDAISLTMPLSDATH